MKERRKLSMKMKLVLSLSAIAVTLLVSSTISVMEYTRMSNYVSGLIAENIRSINLAQRLEQSCDSYNLEILEVIGDEERTRLPDFDQAAFMETTSELPLSEPVLYAYSAYMLTSQELEDVLLSDFVDTRAWYFDRLQPQFARLKDAIDAMSTAVYDQLKANSATFDRGFYRSVIPGTVAVGVGLLLILMLLFFILAYYVNPINKMLDGLNNYRSYNKKYTYNFEGDDQLSELNDGITQLAAENQQLHKRISALRNTLNQKPIQ